MKKIIFSVATALLLSNTMVMAKSSEQVSKDAINSAKMDMQNSNIYVKKEAVRAVELTQKVLMDVVHKDKKSAIKDIESAIGKLEVALSAEKAPKILPIDVTLRSSEYVGDSKKIKEIILSVKDLLSDEKIQEARVLLNTLRSEVDVIMTGIPVATYPDALKLAAKYLHNNELDRADTILTTALSTLVKEVTVVPIPVIKVQGLIVEASHIAKKDKKQALADLHAAKDELQKAKILGYVSKSDVTYKYLERAIEKTEKEIKGKNKAEKLFENLIKNIKSFKDKI